MYKKYFTLLCILTATWTSTVTAQDVDPNSGIIPAPFSVRKTAGEFVVSKQTVVLADTVNAKAVVFSLLQGQRIFRLMAIV